jgi:hypothetical protein
MIFSCCDDLRRDQLADPKINIQELNGIDFLEVLDHDATNKDDRQRRLFVHFINALAPSAFSEANVRIEGGERIRNIVVQKVSIGTGSDAKVMTVDVDQPGDFSIYTLRLVQDADHIDPPGNIDPMFAAVEFSFKVECPSDFDCRPSCDCPPAAVENPDIDYLVKDYGSFRRLMLDRMSLLMPQWQERHAADLGVALVEVLAYVGDYLSYQQDAIATEAYLGTARRRVSVRRHAKLVDYTMHDGCNARTWVQVQVSKDLMLSKGQLLCTRVNGQNVLDPTDPEAQRALAQAHEFFETMEDVALYKDHNELYFYTWGDQRCCLPKGATAATLIRKPDAAIKLKIGDVLIFEEVLGPDTGTSSDADPSKRWAVRLTDVETGFTDSLTSTAIVQIRWAQADALPFSLCISANTDEEHGKHYVENISVARGNIVLVDHGYTVEKEDIGLVPPGLVNPAAGTGCDRCNPVPPKLKAPRYRPSLSQQPLTFAVPQGLTLLFGIDAAAGDLAVLDNGKLPDDLKAGFTHLGGDTNTLTEVQGGDGFWSVGNGTAGYLIRLEQSRLNVYEVPPPASAMLTQDPRRALPGINRLESILGPDKTDWTAQPDLLESKLTDADFVVETESDGVSYLRFGDGELGRAPQPSAQFTASYRIGNGVAGNVGPESIAHVVSSDVTFRDAVSGVRNPLAAIGGTEPESVEQVRAYAPEAFRTQERAVTEQDYAEVTERHPQVQKAQATFRWTGSWRTVFITIDRLGGLAVDDAFKTEIRDFVERYRMAGYDLEVDGPRFVSLEIAMDICVSEDYFREDVAAALLPLFSDRDLPDARRGLFHPDNFTFGQTVYLSPLIAAAQAVEGVQSVQVTTFQRQGVPDPKPLAQGKLEIGRLEIARCANDPDFAEHGVFNLTLGGGK